MDGTSLSYIVIVGIFSRMEGRYDDSPHSYVEERAKA